MTRWFDAHLDLAYLAALGRDMLAHPRSAGGPDLPAGVTLTSLREGDVRACLATIFTEAQGADPRVSYASGDAPGARARGVEQLNIYAQWRARGLVAPLRDVGPAPLRLGLLVEGADPIRDPDDLAWWKAQGVVAVGLAWWRGSRYAGGNGDAGGLTPLGRELVRAMDALDLVHDVSHLSDRAFDEVLSLARGRVMASHSNCRALLGDPANQRHLTDAQVRAIAGRGGVIGLNLYSKFLSARGGDARATIDDCVAHVEHVCAIAGDRRHVGLGSDMDGGFSAARLPEGIDAPSDRDRLAAGLRALGWSDDGVRSFQWDNWARLLGIK